MTNNIIVSGILACISALQTGCMPGKLTDATAPGGYPFATAPSADPVTTTPCGDPLDYYNELSVQIGNKLSTTKTSTLPVKKDTEACFKLQEAIRLSMPGSKLQNDKKALVLLKDLKRTGVLSESDQRFNNMLLQHVSQRQDLRNMIGSQDERLKKTETQLDQLKNIEVEIDKKERSVISPISE